jgi:hypothetical protein
MNTNVDPGQVVSFAAFVGAAICFVAAGWLVHNANYNER